MEHGIKVEYVKANNTSRACPICGEVSKPNGMSLSVRNVASKRIGI